MQNLFILLLILAIFIIAKLNFMASNLFSFGDVRNHPHRSGFDLSRRICFTSKAGELLPVYYKLVYPGDKFQIRHQLFTRTQTSSRIDMKKLHDIGHNGIFRQLFHCLTWFVKQIVMPIN
jgi:hypothetical protein